MRHTLILFFLLFGANCFAQKLELTKADKIEFKKKAITIVNLFKECLEIIPTYEGEGREKTILKDKAIANTMSLFVKGASIELLYANGKKGKMKIPQYLSSLNNYESKGELVDIEIVDFTVDNIKPHPTQLGKYIVEYEFVQIFRKKKSYTSDPLMSKEEIAIIEWDYVDKTTKSGTAIVEKKVTRDGTKWLMLLGDIKADKIVVLK